MTASSQELHAGQTKPMNAELAELKRNAVRQFQKCLLAGTGSYSYTRYPQNARDPDG